MKLKYQFATQQLTDSYVAVAVDRDAAKFDGVLQLNKSGKVILEALQQETTKDAIVQELKKVFAGDEAAMAQQVDLFTANLREMGLLEE